MDSNTNILLSIESRHVENILSGRKSVELRRRKLHIAPCSKVWIYSTLPSGYLAAVATVTNIVSASPDKIWTDYKDEMAITRSEFDAYIGDLKCCHVLLLSDVSALEPVIKLADLKNQIRGFHPPQFFKRLSSEGPELKIFQTAFV